TRLPQTPTLFPYTTLFRSFEGGAKPALDRLRRERADMLVADDAAAIDEERLRHAIHSPVYRRAARAVDADDAIGIAELGEEFQRVRRSVLVVQASEGDTG